MKILVLCFILGALTMGCSNITSREKTALGGAAAGALVGQALGGDSKSTLIGAGIGALGGAAVDNYQNTGNILGD
nr:YMGG-like glycine zipper-containing protein [uncultured Cetobacterium sp.]